MSHPLLYVAYPMRLDLSAANAVQTYNTVRELRKLLPDLKLVVPRWPGEPSAFAELDALHLPRPAINKLSRLVPWAGWSYIERTLYAWMLVLLLVIWRSMGRGYGTLYVRDAVCAAWLGLFNRLHGGRMVYEVHDLEAMHPSSAARRPGWLWARFLPWLDRMSLRRACRLVSLTETFRAWAVERGLRSGREICVIPDAFDPDVYFPMDRQEARRQMGLPPEGCIIGYAGLTFAYRRLDLLVEAFAKIAPMDDYVTLLLVGGRTHERRELRAQALRLGVEERIIMAGQVDSGRTALYLNAADILAIPDTVTQLTASPLKLFEYMAVGRPIVCKDMPALREVLGDDAAAYFAGGDANALAGAIGDLMANSDKAEAIGASALSRSAQSTYEARAGKILEVVRSCP